MLVTRRQVLAGCMAAGAEAMARPVHSCVGAKMLRMSEEDDWPVSAADYVQDGLVAMYDGIENAGWGVHDPNATVWQDLIGSFDLYRKNNPIIGQDFITSYDGTSAVGYFANTAIPSWVYETHPMTMEVVFALDKSISESAFACGGGCLNIMVKSNRIYLVTTRQGKYIPWQKDGYRHTVSFAVSNADWTSSSLLSAYLDGNNATMLNGLLYTFGANYGVFACRMSTSYLFNGCEINCIRLYSRSLTAAEVAANYAIDKRRFGI